MKDLIKEYWQSKQALENYKSTIQELSEEHPDLGLVNRMISDLQFAIDWMKEGYYPENRRGVERLASYQRELPMDPRLMQYVVPCSIEAHSTIGERAQQRIAEALSDLTEREKEIYLMAKGQGLSYSKIATYLSISKSSVQTMIHRAEQKIKKRVNQSPLEQKKYIVVRKPPNSERMITAQNFRVPVLY